MSHASYIALAALAVAGCQFDGGGSALQGGGPGDPDGGIVADAMPPDDAGADASGADARPDARPDAAVDCAGDDLPFVPLNLEPCDVAEPSTGIAMVSAGLYRLDTDSGILTRPVGSPVQLSYELVSQSGGPDLFVLSLDGFFLNAYGTLEVHGSHPLVLVSFADIDIRGTLIAAADGATPGPGGNFDAACVDSTGAPGVEQEDANEHIGGSGGGGGGYGSAGGAGGIVHQSEGDLTSGGMAGGSNTLVPLRGGCAGGPGGASGGGGGGGGGAIELVAATVLHIDQDGAVAVPGGGGRGAPLDEAGGGGGGSGGAIILQATDIDIDGAVTANGGGGGEGSRTAIGDDGDPGSASSATPASGGSAMTNGGDGGSGAAGSDPATDGSTGSNNNTDAAGGGGGGGGAGRIRLESPNPPSISGGAVISPV